MASSPRNGCSHLNHILFLISVNQSYCSLFWNYMYFMPHYNMRPIRPQGQQILILYMLQLNQFQINQYLTYFDSAFLFIPSSSIIQWMITCAVSPNSGIYINLNWLFYSYHPFWIWFRLWRYHFWETLKNNESNGSNIVIPDLVLDSLLFTRERCKTFGSTR